MHWNKDKEQYLKDNYRISDEVTVDPSILAMNIGANGPNAEYIVNKKLSELGLRNKRHKDEW